MVINTTDLMPYIALIGIGFIVAEFLLPTKGFLGIIGAICFVVGTVSLTHHSDPTLRLSPFFAGILNLLVLGTAAVVLYIVHRGYTSDKALAFDLEGKTATVIDWNEQHQRIEIEGAFWLAVEKNNLPLKSGQIVRVIAQDNLTLIVEPVGDPS